MYIQGTLVNHDGISTEVLVRHLSVHAPACHYFVVDPPPGIVMVAAIDWRMVLPDTSVLPAVAFALWSAYDEFILPRRAESPAAGILVQCRNVKGQFDQFTIGGDINDYRDLTLRLEHAFRLLSRKLAPVVVRQMLHETEVSGFWERFGT